MRSAGILAMLLCCVVVAHATQPGQQSVRDGVYTEAQATRGETIYTDQCAACHGTDLAGVTPFPPLTGSVIVKNWSGARLDMIVDRLQTTMPPDDPKKVSRQQHVDVLAYLLKMNGHPAGATELPREAEKLNAIRFEPTTSKK